MTSKIDTDGNAAATGSSFSADVVAAGGGFAAAVVETGGTSRAGGAAEAGGGKEVVVAAGAGGVALGAAGGGLFDSLSKSTSDCEGKASVAYSTDEDDEQETSNGSAPAATRTHTRAVDARPMFCPAPLTRFPLWSNLFIPAQGWRQSGQNRERPDRAGAGGRRERRAR